MASPRYLAWSQPAGVGGIASLTMTFMSLQVLGFVEPSMAKSALPPVVVYSGCRHNLVCTLGVTLRTASSVAKIKSRL